MIHLLFFKHWLILVNIITDPLGLQFLATSSTLDNEKIYKLRNQMWKQTAEIKAARIFVTNPAVLDKIENCSSAAKLLMKIHWSQNKKHKKGRRFTLE